MTAAIVFTTWTDESIAELTRRWMAGESASNIAAALGLKSRNVVIGKVHRLGLQRTSQPRKNELMRAQEAERREKRNERLRQARAELRVLNGGRADPRPYGRRERLAGDYSRLRCVEVVPLNIALMDLEHSHCRFPYGDDPATMTFCGHPTIVRKSYCGPHAGLCFGVWR
jgi:GcrA cell cycle regulator